MHCTKKERSSEEQRVRSLQNTMNSIENNLGGGEGVEGLYGSISGVGMQRILDVMATSCGLGATSHLVDVGAGLCRPLMQALLTTELREATGVEMDPVKCNKAMAFVKQASQAVQRKGLTNMPLPLPLIINLPIEAMHTLNSYTHAYSFWEGVPVDARVGFGRLFAASKSLRSVTLVQRAVRAKDPALAMEDDYGFGPLTLVDSFSVKMNGSGRSFKAYIFNRDPSRPRTEPEYQPTLTPPLPLDHGMRGSSQLSAVDICLPVPLIRPAAVFDAAAAAAQADALAGMGRGARRGCRSLTQAFVDSEDEEADETTALWGSREPFSIAIPLPHKPVQQGSGKKRGRPKKVEEEQKEEEEGAEEEAPSRRQQEKKKMNAKRTKAESDEEYVVGGRPRKLVQQKPRQRQESAEKVGLPPKAAAAAVVTSPTKRRPSAVIEKIKNPGMPEKLVEGAVAGAVPAEEWEVLNVPRKGGKGRDFYYVHLPTGYRLKSIPEVERFRGVRVPAPAAAALSRQTLEATAAEELAAPIEPPTAAAEAAPPAVQPVAERQAVEEAGTLTAAAPAATVPAQPPVGTTAPAPGGNWAKRKRVPVPERLVEGAVRGVWPPEEWKVGIVKRKYTHIPTGERFRSLKEVERFRGVRVPTEEVAAPAEAADCAPSIQLQSQKEKPLKAAPAAVEPVAEPSSSRTPRAAPAPQPSSKSPSKSKRILAALSPKKNTKKAARRKK